MNKKNIKIILSVIFFIIIVTAVILYFLFLKDNDNKPDDNLKDDLSLTEESIENIEEDKKIDESNENNGNDKKENLSEPSDNSDSQISSKTDDESSKINNIKDDSDIADSVQNSSNSENSYTEKEPEKSTIQITGHVSYSSPTECIYTDTYKNANNINIMVYSDLGKTVLTRGNEVIGINVITETPYFVKLWNGDLVFVWESSLGDYLNKLKENGEFYQSYGNTVTVPGNNGPVGGMVKSYDSIIPIDQDEFYNFM